MLSRFDRIPACERTDGNLATAQSALCIASRGKKRSTTLVTTKLFVVKFSSSALYYIYIVIIYQQTACPVPACKTSLHSSAP